MTGSMYSSTSWNRNGNPYLMAISSCFKKSLSLKVQTYKKACENKNSTLYFECSMSKYMDKILNQNKDCLIQNLPVSYKSLLRGKVETY